MTPEERWKAGMQTHRPKKRGKKKQEANLEGDIVVPIRKKKTILLQTPERIAKNAYSKEYNRKKRLASVAKWL